MPACLQGSGGWYIVQVVELRDCDETCIPVVCVCSALLFTSWRILDCSTSMIHLICMHLAFIPVIQKQLDLFSDGWAHHKLRTEGNQTPHYCGLWDLMSVAAIPDSHALMLIPLW